MIRLRTRTMFMLKMIIGFAVRMVIWALGVGDD